MSWYRNYRVIKDEHGDGYILEIYLTRDNEEFSKEFFENVKNNITDYEKRASDFVKAKFSNMKIKTVKIMVGSLMVAAIPMASIPAYNVQAAPAQVSQTKQIHAKGTVTASKLNVRSGPSTAYSVIHTLWKGNRITLVGEEGGWYKIRLSDGRYGWVSKTYISNVTPLDQMTTLNTRGIVTASKLNVRSGPSTSYSVIHLLWNGNNVKVIGKASGWYKIQLSDGRQGWVSGEYLKIESQAPVTTRHEKVDKVIKTAKSLLGTPYVWGGESLEEGGFDCSGFTYYVYGQAGIKLDRVSRDQATNGTYVSYANIQPGDMVFHDLNGDGVVDHVGIYIGNGQMIHSPKTNDVVKTTNINTNYWLNRYVTARRVI